MNAILRMQPLDICLLADLCNHTWIPECGMEAFTKQVKVFSDECDLFEYNCDNQKFFHIVNHSFCQGHSGLCPTRGPCTTCVDELEKYIRSGSKIYYPPGYDEFGNRITTRPWWEIGVPKRRMAPKDGRRYNARRRAYIKEMRKVQKTAQDDDYLEFDTEPARPETKAPRRRDTGTLRLAPPRTQPQRQTRVLRTEIVRKNGRMYKKIIMGNVK